MSRRAALLGLAFVAAVDAFNTSPMHCMPLRTTRLAVSRDLRAPFFPKRATTALRMQTEEDKALGAAAAVALTVTFLTSKVALFLSTILGASFYLLAKLDTNGNQINDTAKTIALTVGEYTLKTVEYIQKQDAEGGYTKKAVDAIKESVGSK